MEGFITHKTTTVELISMKKLEHKVSVPGKMINKACFIANNLANN